MVLTSACILNLILVLVLIAEYVLSSLDPWRESPQDVCVTSHPQAQAHPSSQVEWDHSLSSLLEAVFLSWVD